VRGGRAGGANLKSSAGSRIERGGSSAVVGDSGAHTYVTGSDIGHYSRTQKPKVKIECVLFVLMGGGLFFFTFFVHTHTVVEKGSRFSFGPLGCSCCLFLLPFVLSSSMHTTLVDRVRAAAPTPQ
jgi:hypothetical protein